MAKPVKLSEGNRYCIDLFLAQVKLCQKESSAPIFGTVEGEYVINALTKMCYENIEPNKAFNTRKQGKTPSFEIKIRNLEVKANIKAIAAWINKNYKKRKQPGTPTELAKEVLSYYYNVSGNRIDDMYKTPEHKNIKIPPLNDEQILYIIRTVEEETKVSYL